VRRFFNVLGCLLAIPNIALDIGYIAKVPFYDQTPFLALIIILLLRTFLLLSVCQYFLFK